MAPSTVKDVPEKQVIGYIKKGMSINDAAKAAGVTPQHMTGLFFRLESEADPSLQIKGTPKQVAKAIVVQRASGVRWERLAGRTGLSVAAVKAAFEDETGLSAAESYVGRGRNFADNGTPKGGKASTKPKAAAGKATSTTEPKRRGRPPGSGAKAGAKPGPKPKAKTRAARQAKAGGRTPS